MLWAAETQSQAKSLHHLLWAKLAVQGPTISSALLSPSEGCPRGKSAVSAFAATLIVSFMAFCYGSPVSAKFSSVIPSDTTCSLSRNIRHASQKKAAQPKYLIQKARPGRVSLRSDEPGNKACMISGRPACLDQGVPIMPHSKLRTLDSRVPFVQASGAISLQ